jgi:thymidylate kinase
MSKGISVLIEGLDGVGKTTIVSLLKHALNGIIIKTPPEIISSARDWFVQQHSEYRDGYYMVGNYISSNQINDHMNRGINVVIDRFFPSTKAYIYGKDLNFNIDTYEEQWPEIILKPTFMFVLRLDNDIRISRMENRGNMTDEEILIKHNPEIVNRINQIYVKLGCIPIDILPEWTPEDVVSHLLKIIQKN